MTTRTTHISGVGAVTGYGWGTAALWDGLASGKAAATMHHGFSRTDDNPVWLAKVASGGDERDGKSRFGRALRGAAREAIEDALKRGWKPGRKVGLLHAVVLGDVDEWRSFYIEEGGQRRVRDYLTLMPSTPMSLLMQEYNFHGPAMAVGAMCASGNAGLITAKMWLDAGIVDDVVFVTTDLSATPENVEHFVRLGVGIVDVEPQVACRPFQTGSRGFPAGEASAAFVLSGKSAGAYGAVLGGAMSHDAFHATSIDPNLAHVRGCFEDALNDAGVAPRTCGTSTPTGPARRNAMPPRPSCSKPSSNRTRRCIRSNPWPATARARHRQSKPQPRYSDSNAAWSLPPRRSPTRIPCCSTVSPQPRPA